MTKNFLLFIVPFITLPLFAQTPVAAAPARMPDTITVTGNARVTTVPDRVSFTIGVETQAPNVDDAVRENNRKVSAMIAALKSAGAADKDIRTSNFSIYPQQQYVEGQPPRLLGYQVTNSVTVTKDKPAEAGKLLQVAIGAGANQASGLNFSVADSSAGRIQGLKLAFDDARGRAKALADAAGRTLGNAIMITEGGTQNPYPPPMPMRAMAMQAQAAPVPVESGSEELNFALSVTFEMR